MIVVILLALITFVLSSTKSNFKENEKIKSEKRKLELAAWNLRQGN